MTDRIKSPQVDLPAVDTTIDLRDGVVRHRASLKFAMSRLESRLARPVGPDGAIWIDRVDAATQDLGAELGRHIAVHEGPNSFHAEMLASQPYLTPRVERLRREHVRAQQVLAELIVAISSARSGPVLAPAAAEVRMLGTDLLLLLVHHRQRGADLVWESVNLDLGSGD